MHLLAASDSTSPEVGRGKKRKAGKKRAGGGAGEAEVGSKVEGKRWGGGNEKGGARGLQGWEAGKQ